jgi:hypothetical protein
VTAEQEHVANTQILGVVLDADVTFVCLCEEDIVVSCLSVSRDIGVARKHEGSVNVSRFLDHFVTEHVFSGAELAESSFHWLIYDEARLINEREVAAESLQNVPLYSLDDDLARLFGADG